jgi:hypothetical protein
MPPDLSRSLARCGFPQIFTAAEGLQEPAVPAPLLPGIAKTRAPPALLREDASSACTKSGHAPVDGLHSIENKSDRGTHFSLTSKLERVQGDRSLTVS